MDQSQPIPIRSLLITVVLAIGIGLGLLKLAGNSRDSYHQRTLEAAANQDQENEAKAPLLHYQDFFTKGQALYRSSCASCHGATGEGSSNIIPPLGATSYLSDEKLIHIIHFGLQGEIQVNAKSYNGVMPAITAEWEEDDIASLMTYVQNSFGEKAETYVSMERVAELKKLLRARTSSRAMTSKELDSLSQPNRSTSH